MVYIQSQFIKLYFFSAKKTLRNSYKIVTILQKTTKKATDFTVYICKEIFSTKFCEICQKWQLNLHYIYVGSIFLLDSIYLQFEYPRVHEYLNTYQKKQTLPCFFYHFRIGYLFLSSR